MLQKFPLIAYIPAGDVARARRFYEGELGFEPKEEIADGVVFEHDDMPGERSPGGAITAGGAKAAWFKDTEGNILAIIQAVPAA